MASSSSRGRSSSPFLNQKPTSPYSSTSSTSSLANGRVMPQSCSSSVTSVYGGGGGGDGYGARSATPSQSVGDYPQGRALVSYPSVEDRMIGEPENSTSGSADSISVTIRFRPLRCD